MGVQRRPKKGSPQDKGQKPRWMGRYRDKAGQEHAKGFSSERAAKAWVAEQERALRRGEWISPEDEATTLHDLAKLWHAEATKDNTIANRKALMDNLGYIGTIPVGAVSRDDISAWNKVLLKGRPWKNGRPLSASTVAVMTGQVAGLLRRAHEDGLILRVPKISMAKAPPRMAVSRQELVTPEEISQIITVATEGKENAHGPDTPPRPWLSDMVWVAIGTGVRISELCALWPDDLDVLKLELVVERQVAPGGMELAPLKTERPRRLPISESVADILQRRIKELKVGRRQPIFPYQGDGRVYHDRNSAGTRLNRVVNILGMRPVTFHDFRHYYASVMIASGASVAEVQAALGHQRASTTLDTYTHLFGGHEDRTRAAAGTAVDLVRAACGQKVDDAPPNELEERRQGRSGT